MDVTELTTAIAGLETDVTMIGAALIGIAGVVLVYRWLKGFLFG